MNAKPSLTSTFFADWKDRKMRQLDTYTARFMGTDETQEFESLSRSDAYGMAIRYAFKNDLIVTGVSREVNDVDFGRNDCAE